MKKAYILGFIVGLAMLIVAGVASSKLQHKDSEQAKHQAELVDATPVQLGVLTQNQRLHSKLYSHYRQVRDNQTISELVAQAKGKSNYVKTGVFVGLGRVRTEPETPENYFSKLARESDAVIQGRVTRKFSQVTEDDSFVFTDYDVEVTEVLKNNASTPLDSGVTITVTRPGGKIVIDGVIVNVIDEYYAPLPLNNHDLVLFLKFVSETGAYKATRYNGSFELENLSLHPLTGVNFPPGVLQDGPSFLKTARAVSNK